MTVSNIYAVRYNKQSTVILIIQFNSYIKSCEISPHKQSPVPKPSLPDHWHYQCQSHPPHHTHTFAIALLTDTDYLFSTVKCEQIEARAGLPQCTAQERLGNCRINKPTRVRQKSWHICFKIETEMIFPNSPSKDINQGVLDFQFRTIFTTMLSPRTGQCTKVVLN